ncbi:MAG: hypothetical protein JNL62_09665 [Bryobacterales bacterium]|nr:hypothetical protein [Bryobacterales bacterium]
MAFKLTKLDDELFSAAATGSVQVELSANRGAVAVLSLLYGSQQTTANPATLQIEPGVHDILYQFQATNNDAFVRLEEIDGGNRQRLSSRPAFDSSLSVEVRAGVAAPASFTATTKRSARKVVRKRSRS